MSKQREKSRDSQRVVASATAAIRAIDDYFLAKDLIAKRVMGPWPWPNFTIWSVQRVLVTLDDCRQAIRLMMTRVANGEFTIVEAALASVVTQILFDLMTSAIANGQEVDGKLFRLVTHAVRATKKYPGLLHSVVEKKVV